MNIEEAKKYVKENATNGYFENQVVMPKEEILDLLDKLNHHKPVVPQYVADWYEEHKGIFEESLFSCIYHIEGGYSEKTISKFGKWLINNEQALTTIINMHQYGYEVYKEPRYKVTFKGLNMNKHLCCNLTRENWYLWHEKESKMCHTSHTRKELEEAGFGWVFDCEGVEVKEVE